MATTYNIEIREFNGTDYDILYPKTKMDNVDGLVTTISTINDNISSVDGKTQTNASNISNLNNKINTVNTNIGGIQSDIENIETSITTINGNISSLQDSVSNKQDKSDLGTLAFKSKISLGSSDTSGKLPIAKGGTGATTASDALSNLGITISNISIEEGDALESGLIYIYYE